MSSPRSFGTVASAVAVVLVACGNSQNATNCNSTGTCFDASHVSDGNLGDAMGSPSDASEAGPVSPGTDASNGPPLPGPQPTCSVPIQPVDTSQPTTLIGFNGIPCTEQALRDAVAKGGTIKFSCASTPTIPITQTIEFPIDKDTTIDGGNVVALDGGNLDGGSSTGTRIFSFKGSGYRSTKTTVTLQHIDILNGNAPGTPMAMAPPPCSQGANTDGGGGAIYVHDGILHVIDVGFTGNQAAPLGPGVGGGAIFADGSLDVTVHKSRFTSNGGSNGGAIVSMNSDLTLVEAIFSNNQARGNGGNMSCGVDGGQAGNVDGGQVGNVDSGQTGNVDGGQPGSVDSGQAGSVDSGQVSNGGNGGNGGAVAISGGSDGKVTVCGCNFAHNTAGAFGGALSRTADSMTQDLNVDQTGFDTNTAAQGGGAMYVHNCNLNITASTFSMNSAPSAGGIQADATKINFVNDTFSNNSATVGSGGAVSLASNGGSIQSCTFAQNHADYKMGGANAALAGAMVTINDTIFWDNQTMDCMSPMTCQNASNTGQANLQWPNRHTICTDSDPPCTSSGTMFADAMLAALKVMGGPTQTMVPMAMSPAIGAGTSCPATDQRGVQRKATGCTVGAVEVP